MSAGSLLPTLYVEGKDDISVINALLFRHAIDTHGGTQHLYIADLKNVESVLANMPDVIRKTTAFPVGFVVDIDIELTHRWDAVRGHLQQFGITAPAGCPPDGFFGKLPSYPHHFGVWLMPDCRTDGQMLENLVRSLMPAQHPLWPHAQSSTGMAATLVDNANAAITGNNKKWKRFSDNVRIKAEVRSWLAWQSEPGVQLGAAINDHILGHDSPEALAFLRWLKRLYGVAQLNHHLIAFSSAAHGLAQSAGVDARGGAGVSRLGQRPAGAPHGSRDRRAGGNVGCHALGFAWA